jgi:hypothetical protein
MSTLKTTENESSVRDFIESVQDQAKKEDSYTLLELFKKVTDEEPKMWGKSIVGFGKYHYKSERSKQEGDWMLTGFSPRKQNLTLYLISGFEKYTDLLAKLGKYKTSVGCLYINKLSDVDLEVLKKLIKENFEEMKKMNGII